MYHIIISYIFFIYHIIISYIMYHIIISHTFCYQWHIIISYIISSYHHFIYRIINSHIFFYHISLSQTHTHTHTHIYIYGVVSELYVILSPVSEEGSFIKPKYILHWLHWTVGVFLSFFYPTTLLNRRPS